MAAGQRQGGAWPCQYVQAVPSGLADGLLQQLLTDAASLAAADNFWMPLVRRCLHRCPGSRSSCCWAHSSSYCCRTCGNQEVVACMAS